MARIESIAKGGFFPTPPSVVATIATWLSVEQTSEPRVVRAFDPCCGDGDALQMIGRAIGAETYGVELNHERGEKARQQLDHALIASAFEIRTTPGFAHLLFLNPPYDIVGSGDDGKREEVHFLNQLGHRLAPGGVLIYIIPQYSVPYAARTLSSWYTDLAVYRFPDGEYERFKQVVVFGRKRRAPETSETWHTFLRGVGEMDLNPIMDGHLDSGGTLYTVPSSRPSKDVAFQMAVFDAERAVELCRTKGAWMRPEVADALYPPGDGGMRPLMPLRKGHMALIIAAGMLNNQTLVGRDGRRVLVKGQVKKTFKPVPSGKEDTEVMRETISTTVTILDLATGEVEHVGAAPKKEEEKEGPANGQVVGYQGRPDMEQAAD